ncbi:MAG: hypothetical protein IT445_00120 [Phycisphaeraceae bacterium]|nr:hypothetical protein [Phycisphaeraceae bacterium]
MHHPRFQDGDTVRLISDDQSLGVVCMPLSMPQRFGKSAIASGTHVFVDWQAGTYAGRIKIHPVQILMLLDPAPGSPIGGAA